MKTAIKIIKRQQKLKEPIKLRVKNLKNGNQSLYLDIYWQGKRTYQFLHLYLVPEINEQTIAQNQEVARQALLIKSRKIIKLLGNMPKHEGNGATRKYYLLDFIQKYADERKPKTGNCTRGRYGSIISLKKHLIKFGAKNTLVGEVDVKFVERFIEYLREAHDLHPNRKKPSKLSEGTIYLMYSILRSITIELYKKKLIPQNPYSLLPSQFRLKRPESTRNYLSKSELAKVIQSECKYPQLKEAFLFSCFTGLRKSDILSLTWEEIIRENGKVFIQKKIQKTQRWLKIPLSHQAMQWLPKRPGRSMEGIIFDEISHSAMSKQLKAWLGTIKNLNKEITFHCGRHTFATLELSFGASLYTVASLLGHKNITTTQVYAKVVNKEKERAVGLIDKNFK